MVKQTKIGQINSIKYITMLLLTIIYLIPSISNIKPVYALYPGSDLGESADKWVGTASKEVELAIAAGKTLLPVTTYGWGAGHQGDWSNNKPAQLDCSSFTDWVYRKGAGVQIGNSWGYTTPAIASESRVSKYWHEDSSLNGVKRGDLIINNGGGHIVMFLGKEGETYITMGCNGTNDAGGVSIVNWMISPLGYISMGKLIEEGSFDKFEDTLKDLKADGKSTETKDAKTSDNTTSNVGNGGDQSKADHTFTLNGYGSITNKEWKEALNNADEYVNNQNPSNDLSNNQKNELNEWIDDYNMNNSSISVKKSHLVITILGFLLMLYSILIMVSYSFDRVGILELSVLSLVTMGRIETAYTSEDSTFLKKKNGSEPKMASFKDIILICILLTGLFTLVISGKIYELGYLIYSLIQSIIQWGNSLH